jgi:flavin-dependent dehydrogenase
MSDVMHYDVLVVGAGPAGATAAHLLARAGWSAAIVEKSAFPRRKVCGEFVSATSLRLLDDPDIRHAFFDRAGPEVQQVGVFASDAVLFAPMPGTRDSNPWGRALGREHLDLLLLEAAARAGARVWLQWTVTDVRRDREGHVCTIASKGVVQELRARIVIGANGSWEHSPVRHDKRRTHRHSDLLAFKAHFRDSELPSGLMPLLVFPGGYGGMVHTDAGRVSLSCCIRRDALQHCRRTWRDVPAADAVLQHVQRACWGARDALRHSQLEGAWLSAGPIRPGIRTRYENDIFYVGNAAGEAHPIIAEGISMAMQSAWLLCRRLIQSQDKMAVRDAVAEIGREYAKEWKTTFWMRIRAAAVFANILIHPNRAGLVLPILKRFPAVLTWGARLSGKTNVLGSASFHLARDHF